MLQRRGRVAQPVQGSGVTVGAAAVRHAVHQLVAEGAALGCKRKERWLQDMQGCSWVRM